MFASQSGILNSLVLALPPLCVAPQAVPLVGWDLEAAHVTHCSTCSNVVYHGEMAKKSEMERKRAEPNDENEGECYV